MKNRAFSSLILVVVALMFCGCAVRAVKTTEAGDPGADKRVLIATQQSDESCGASLHFGEVKDFEKVKAPASHAP